MGVSINGKIPSGFAVNGKSVSGLAYNGKVIFKKNNGNIDISTLENLIYNSNFRYNDNGYKDYSEDTNYNSIISNPEDGWLQVKAQRAGSTISIGCTLTEDLIPGHTYYARCRFDYNQPNGSYRAQLRLKKTRLEVGQTIDSGLITEQPINLSGFFTVNDETYLTIDFVQGGNSQSTTIQRKIKEPTLIDVTDLINSGISKPNIKSALDNTFISDEVYRRRIQVGDNLKGKKIYTDFNTVGYIFNNKPVGYDYQTMFALEHDIISNEDTDLATNNWLSQEGSETFIEINNNSLNISDVWNKPLLQVKHNLSSNNVLWEYNNGSVTSIEVYDTASSTDMIVSSIVNQVSYRRLYIKDSYIRPFKIGDKINQDTVIYCIIPDYYGPAALHDANNTDDYCTTGFTFNNDIIKFNYKWDERLGNINEYTISCTINSQSEVKIFQYDYQQQMDVGQTNYGPNWTINVPKLDFSGQTFETEVTSIDENIEIFTKALYYYLLVDTRTLVK